MSGATNIFLGDLARALASAGGPRGESWPRIAAMLGFTRTVETTAVVAAGGSLPGAAGEMSASARAVGDTALSTAVDTADIGALIEFNFERTLSPPLPLPPPGATTAPAVPTPPVLKPLFDSLWERGILIATAGRPLPEGEIDVLAVVEKIARGEALGSLPREMVQSVTKGCQLLLDNGVGMRPFAADARQLVRSVRRAVGAVHTRVLTFIDCPTTGVLTQNYDEEAYAAPENGAVVLAVSDLCTGGPSGAIRRAPPRDWLKIARTARDAGSALVVLNPYPPKRWPEAVSSQVPVIYWNRRARAADVRITRRRARA
jgi:hypothetical protein